MLRKIKIIIAAITLAVVMFPIAGVSAIEDTRSINTTDDVPIVPNTGEVTSIDGSAAGIGVGIFLGVMIIPVIIAVSIERRYSGNKFREL